MSAICKDCGLEYDAYDKRMVMLKDKLWMSICDDEEDCLCDFCIMDRMGRGIEMDDFKESTDPERKHIPVNEDYIIEYMDYDMYRFNYIPTKDVEDIQVKRTYIFFEKDNKANPKFEIEANHPNDAYETAWYRYDDFDEHELYYCIKTKFCSGCKKDKTLNYFYRDKSTSDGYYSLCKKCKDERTKNYIRTKEGLIKQIYATQRAHAKSRGHEVPNYNKVELKDWLLSQDIFNELYDKWAESGYDMWAIPSTDRIDDYKTYSLDNIKITTWRQNLDNRTENIKKGKNNKISKTVLQYDLDGNFIKEYYSAHQASRITGIGRSNICTCCRGKYYQAGGFKWKYKEQ